MYVANKVNLLLCPYNYILNPTIRKSMQIKVKDAIIIFDEAHNIENISEQCCSSELALDDLFNHKEIITD